jgi:hypothetical protein
MANETQLLEARAVALARTDHEKGASANKPSVASRKLASIDTPTIVASAAVAVNLGQKKESSNATTKGGVTAAVIVP